MVPNMPDNNQVSPSKICDFCGEPLTGGWLCEECRELLVVIDEQTPEVSDV
jgi:hypothetical protein